ncbi:MAG: carbohydrate kinase [bacterium]
MNILAFGEVLWDIMPEGTVLGGAPFNFAFRANSLGHRAMMVSRLGRDDLGRQAEQRMRELNMDTRFVQWDSAHPTGTVKVTLDENNQPDYFIVPDVAYDAIEMTEELALAAGKADCVCYGTLAQRSPRSRETLAHILQLADQALKVLDINLRENCYTRESIMASLERADVLKLNEDEARYLMDLFALEIRSLPEFCERIIQDWLLQCCVITLGERGALAMAADGKPVYVPGFLVTVVDPVGSGDAFTAGFITQYFQGKRLEDGCRYGNALGAMVAATAGGTAPIPPGEIDEFLRGGPARVEDRGLAAYRIV